MEQNDAAALLCGKFYRVSADYDIAVVGAGAAGVLAASEAAGAGARVILIEATNRLGGAVTAAMHRSLCGLYAREPREPAEVLNPGPQQQFIDRLVARAPDHVKTKQLGPAWVLEFPSPAYEAALEETLQHPNITRRILTRVHAIHRSGSSIASVTLDHSESLSVRALIDCTGGGHALQLIGEDVLQPRDDARMLAGYALRIAGLSGDAESLRLMIPYTLAQAARRGDLPQIATLIVFHPGPGDAAGVLKLAMDPEDAADVELLSNNVIATLQRELDAFSAARVVERSPTAIARDGRRLLGRATLTGDDVLNAQQLNEEAVHAWWPVERWDPQRGPTYQFAPSGEHYDISTDTLRSATIENLYAAGSCLSATADAAASSRVSGICLATGAAAGRLAAASLS